MPQDVVASALDAAASANRSGAAGRLSPRNIILRRVLLVATILLAGIPWVAFAQLPTPTYGWNLGNTLEPPSGEGTWGPPATQALIDSVAASGFNTVRIPCAWNSHADPSSHQIDPTYMTRVKQVVDWCYARNLTVIINSHWDGGWLDTKITDKVDSTITDRIKSFWTQIATRFKDYDDKLLFAGTNEPEASTAAQMSTLLAYHQTFVDAVRATGGNNLTRWLVVQGPNTNIDQTDTLMNTLPSDPTPNRLAVEVHYYAPYQWALMPKDADWGGMFYFWGQGYHSATMPARNSTWGEESYVDAELQKMYAKFVSRGIPVILGEFQAIKRIGFPGLSGADFQLHVASRTHFHKYVVDAANSRGIKPIYWDIAGQLFDWTTGAVTDQDNKNALTGGAELPPPGGASGGGTPSRLVNLSTRAIAGKDSSTLIAGFIIQGNASRKVLIRAGGPYLAQFGVDNPLSDPLLTLFAGQQQVLQNDDWGSDATNIATVTAQVGAVSFSAGSKDAAITATLQPGVPYTAQVTGNKGTVGNAIIEVFDADSDTTSSLVNLSTRSYVGTGASIQIGGFILHGGGPARVLIRAGGPYLSQYGIADALADPVVTLYAGQQQIAQNDNWGDNADAVSHACAQVGVPSYANGSKDSALVLTLSGDVPYTAQVSGKNGGVGNALIEIFQLP